MFLASAVSSTVIRLFFHTILSTAWILFSVLDVDGLPDLSSSHTEVFHFFKWSSTRKFYCAINIYHRIEPAFDE
jgi:hypothetical protein